ncbi:MAG: flagellar hook-length control protein FliK [Betaproteobacteria bacterium]|nr:flagellar hook-length control protein FliK [Betaproteobacteria bacterium]
MPEPIAVATSPAMPARSGPAPKNGESGEGNAGLGSPAAPALAQSEVVSCNPASSQEETAPSGGFEELLAARLAMMGTTAADSRTSGGLGAAKSRSDDLASAEDTSETGIVAAVLAETAALAPATEVPVQAASVLSPGTAALHSQQQAVPAADPSASVTGMAIPISSPLANQVTPPTPSPHAPASGLAESSPARRTSSHSADPAGTAPGPAGAEASDRSISTARPERTVVLADDKRGDGKPEMPPQQREGAFMAASAPVQTDRVPELPPRADIYPSNESRPSGPMPVTHVSHPLASAEWNREFGTQVTLFVSRKDSQAEIRVNPPELGPVEVRIGFDGDKVSVAFAATPAETRQAIQDALPQLRELLAERGLSLGNATVGAESSPREFAPAPRFAGHNSSREATPVRETHAVHLTHRLVDTFA